MHFYLPYQLHYVIIVVYLPSIRSCCYLPAVSPVQFSSVQFSFLFVCSLSSPTFLEHLCTDLCYLTLDARGHLAWTSLGIFISSIITFKVQFSSKFSSVQGSSHMRHTSTMPCYKSRRIGGPWPLEHGVLLAPLAHQGAAIRCEQSSACCARACVWLQAPAWGRELKSAGTQRRGSTTRIHTGDIEYFISICEYLLTLFAYIIIIQFQKPHTV